MMYNVLGGMLNLAQRNLLIYTSSKAVMFYPEFVCPCVLAT